VAASQRICASASSLSHGGAAASAAAIAAVSSARAAAVPSSLLLGVGGLPFTSLRVSAAQRQRARTRHNNPHVSCATQACIGARG
jgi:hypothetical protein